MALTEERRKYQREWKRAAHNYAPQRRPSSLERAAIHVLLSLGKTHASIAKRIGWSKALVDKIARERHAFRSAELPRRMHEAARLLAADWPYDWIRRRVGISLDDIGCAHAQLDALLEED